MIRTNNPLWGNKDFHEELARLLREADALESALIKNVINYFPKTSLVPKRILNLGHNIMHIRSALDEIANDRLFPSEHPGKIYYGRNRL